MHAATNEFRAPRSKFDMEFCDDMIVLHKSQKDDLRVVVPYDKVVRVLSYPSKIVKNEERSRMGS